MGWMGIHRECPPCFWFFPMGEMLEHLWAWLDISAGVWLFPGQDLSSDLVFGVVVWGGTGFVSALLVWCSSGQQELGQSRASQRQRLFSGSLHLYLPWR